MKRGPEVATELFRAYVLVGDGVENSAFRRQDVSIPRR